jgi:hypothetical protein
MLMFLHVSHIMILKGRLFERKKKSITLASSAFQIAHMSRIWKVRFFNAFGLVFEWMCITGIRPEMS